MFISVYILYGWDSSDDTDADGFAMIVTVFVKLEFSQNFYNIHSPKYPLYLELAHDYLRRTSKIKASWGGIPLCDNELCWC